MDYANEHMDVTDNRECIGEEDVYVVWYCKTLQNWKSLLSTILPDGMYYEITVNGDKNEVYLDAYKKFENRCRSLDDFVFKGRRIIDKKGTMKMRATDDAKQKEYNSAEIDKEK